MLHNEGLATNAQEITQVNKWEHLSPYNFTSYATCNNSPAHKRTSWETRSRKLSSGQLAQYTEWGSSRKTRCCIVSHVSCQHSASHLMQTSVQWAAVKLAAAMHHEPTGTYSHHPRKRTCANIHYLVLELRTKVTKILNTSKNAPPLLTIHTAFFTCSKVTKM